METQATALPSELLGRQVKKWRDRRKISAQALAKRCAEVGAPALTRAAISKIEIGQRGVSVDEWLALAYALNMPPALLLVDLESGTDVAITPARPVSPWEAWDWIAGLKQPASADRTPASIEEFEVSRRAITFYENDKQVSGRALMIEYERSRARYANNADRVRELDEQFVDALKDVAYIVDLMIEIGLTPPAKPKAWIKTMRDLGLLRYPDHVPVYVSLVDDASQNADG